MRIKVIYIHLHEHSSILVYKTIRTIIYSRNKIIYIDLGHKIIYISGHKSSQLYIQDIQIIYTTKTYR